MTKTWCMLFFLSFLKDYAEVNGGEEKEKRVGKMIMQKHVRKMGRRKKEKDGYIAYGNKIIEMKYKG